MRSHPLIQALLVGLVLVDAALVVWAFGFPELWFGLFHRTLEGSAGAELFLKRCGANWGGFLLFQLLALKYWKAQPFWLAIVAGLRFSDIFTDAVYALFAEDLTWIAALSLPIMGLLNFALGWFFLRSYQLISSDPPTPRP
ncbi:MAG: hypothetical protein ACOCXM_09085 [Myxococcota bacterium]